LIQSIPTFIEDKKGGISQTALEEAIELTDTDMGSCSLDAENGKGKKVKRELYIVQW
jgi:hypothetical protein